MPVKYEKEHQKGKGKEQGQEEKEITGEPLGRFPTQGQELRVKYYKFSY